MNDDLRTAMRRAHDAGLCVLPAATDGSKRPAVAWKGFQAGRPALARLGDLMHVESDGIGIVCGAVSGNLEMFEFEEAAIEAIGTTFFEHARAAGLSGLIERIQAGYEETTPAGGIHWLYRCEEPVEGNLKLACVPGDGPNDVQVWIETRGEGGWTVVAPSGGWTHPSGRPWVLQHGGFDQIATITARERRQLLDFARTYDRVPKPAIVLPTSPQGIAEGMGAGVSLSPDTSTKPGHVFNREHTWDAVLVKHGWTRLLTDQDAETHWSRPGKSPAGTSATTNYRGTDLLKVFSSSTPFSTERTYDRFGAFAILEHEGDLSAAGRAVRLIEPARPVSDLLATPDNMSAHVPHDPDAYVERWRREFVDWPPFWDQDHSAEEWLCEPFLIPGRAHALYAQGKAGKSLLVLEVAASMALGRPVLQRPAGERIRVLYLDYEMNERDLQMRLLRMGFSKSDELYPWLAYKNLNLLPPLDNAEGGEAIRELATYFDSQLVVVDTMARAVEGGENDADTVRAMYRHTVAPLKALGMTLIRIDHAGKDASRGQRGSSAKADDVDVVFQMTVKEDVVSLRCERQRVGYVPSQTTLRRHEDPLHHTILEDLAETELIRNLATRLDEIGVPRVASRPEVRQAMGEWNKTHAEQQVVARTEALAAAIRLRKSEASNTPLLDLI